MKLHEAIEKAGVPCRLRRESWESEVYIYQNSNSIPFYDSISKDAVIFTRTELTATDWQVVEPEKIEVGDEARSSCPCYVVGSNCKVYWLSNDKSRCFISNGDCSCVPPVKNVTLIRKGAKEGMSLTEAWSTGEPWPKPPSAQHLDDAITLLKAVLDRPVEGGQSILNPRDRSDIETFLKEVGAL